MARRAFSGRGILRAIETAPGGGWTWFLILIGWILLRNLLESVVETPQQMGFDWRGDVSFPMFFLHFPLFYLSLFLLLTLWLHALSGKRIGAVARVVSAGFGLLLLVPIIDHLVSRGSGFDLRYLTGLTPEVWRFWDLRAAASVVSPGQRVEIAAAVGLCALYVFVVRRDDGQGNGAARIREARHACGPRLAIPALLALLGAVGAYLIMALLGAWPALFARLALPGMSDAQAAYIRCYQLQGLVAEESRRHALVMAIPALLALPFFLWRLAAPAWSALLRRMSWTRLIHYTGMAPAGVFVGALMYREYLPGAFGNPVDFVAIGVLWIALVAAFLAALLWNDLSDRETDRLNAPQRPLVSGGLAESQARALAMAAGIAALALALCVGYAPFLLMIGCLWLAWLYSAPPARLKRWPLIATLTLALLSVVSLAIGFSLFAQEMTPRVIPGRLVALLLVGITLGFTAKDLRDAAGDRHAGITTLATLLPPRTARRVTALLVAIGFLCAPLCLPMGLAFTMIAAVCALAGAVLTLRRERPDEPLLVLFLGFAVVALVALAHHPQILRSREPAALRELHARTRSLEEDARVVRRLREARRDPQGAALCGVALPSVDAILDGIERALALVPAASAAPLGTWYERLHWARAQIASQEVAARDLARLVQSRPLRAAYLEAELEAESVSGDVARGSKIASEAIERGVRPGDFLRHRAALALSSGSASAPVDAAGDLTGAFLFGQDETTLWVLLGDLELQRAEASAAADGYRKAIARDSASSDAWSGLGQALHAGHDLPGALAALDEARRLSPDDPWVRNNRGVVLRDAGRLDEARVEFETAHRLAPTLFEPIFNLGQVSEAAGRLDEARAWYSRASGLRPGFPPLDAARARLAARASVDASEPAPGQQDHAPTMWGDKAHDR